LHPDITQQIVSYVYLFLRSTSSVIAGCAHPDLRSTTGHAPDAIRSKYCAATNVQECAQSLKTRLNSAGVTDDMNSMNRTPRDHAIAAKHKLATTG
jgi:hypothetical protein